MEQKLGHFLESGEERLSDEEIQKLGKKNSKEYPFIYVLHLTHFKFMIIIFHCIQPTTTNSIHNALK